MGNLGSFETTNPLSPAVHLIFNASYYNDRGIREIADQLEYNFTRLSGVIPEYKHDFYQTVREKISCGEDIWAVTVVSTPFFQSMVKRDPPIFYHEQVVTYIVPEMLKAYSGVVYRIQDSDQDRIVKDWLARFVEMYTKEEDIMRSYNFQGGIIPKPDVVHQKIINNLDKSINEGRLSNVDIALISNVATTSLGSLSSRSDHLSETLKFTGWYLTLFAMDRQYSWEFGKSAIMFLNQFIGNQFAKVSRKNFQQKLADNGHDSATAPPAKKDDDV